MGSSCGHPAILPVSHRALPDNVDACQYNDRVPTERWAGNLWAVLTVDGAGSVDVPDKVIVHDGRALSFHAVRAPESHQSVDLRSSPVAMRPPVRSAQRCPSAPNGC